MKIKKSAMDKTYVDQPGQEKQKNQEPPKNPHSKEDRKFAEGRIIIRKISKKQREKLRSVGASGLAGLLGGAGAFSLMSFATKQEAKSPLPPESEPTPDLEASMDPETTPDPNPVVIYTQAPFAQGVDDSMSFNEAFAAAREEVGEGGIFEWNGNTYGTYYKEEWDNLTPEEKHDYWESVANQTTKIDEEPGPIPDGTEATDPGDTIDPDLVDPASEENVYTITEDDFITSIDEDNDGVAEAAIVDANFNDQPDVVVDLDQDGTMDVLILDVDAETGEITGDEVMVELDDEGAYHLQEKEEENNEEYAQDDEADHFIDDELNPDLDNNADMDDYIA